MLKKSLLFGLILAAGCVPRGRFHKPCETPCEPTYRCGQMMECIAVKGQATRNYGLKETSQEVDTKGVSRSQVTLRMKEGSLWMMGGSEELVQASLKYPHNEKPPLFFSLTSGGMREVDIGSKSLGEEWHIALSDNVPVTLAIDSEGGNRNLKLEDVPLVGIYVQALDGTTNLAPIGSQPFLNALDLSHDRGSIALDLSGSYGVLADASVFTAHGNIAGKFTGYYPRLEHLKVTSVEGDVELNLSGAWRRPCHMTVRATCGDCYLCIPCGLGASVKVHKGSCGKVCAPCMYRKWSNGAYVNAAYGKSEAFLDIEVYISEGTVHIMQETQHECCCLYQ